MNAQKKIEGYTTIDHRIRCALKLTVEEYVMADVIYQHNKRFKQGFVSYAKYHSITGFLPEEIMIIGKSLVNKGIVVNDTKLQRHTTAPLWNINFDEDVQFAKLWSINNRGNKQAAKENFLKMRKMIGFNALVIKLQEYMESVSDPNFVMKLQKWLDPKYRHWEDELYHVGTTLESSLNDNSMPSKLF
ncbi:MAG: hypothetical protein IT212_07830 [Bacteroidia bacterium]|nr:hypothetical protein [Bacteroidia bacterium]